VVSGLIDTYADSMNCIQMHNGDQHAVPWGNQRAGFYNFQYIPQWYVDGLVGTYILGQFESNFLTRVGVPTDVTMTLDGTPVNAIRYGFTAEVCIEAAGDAKTMRIYMVQALDHYPAYPSYSRNTVRQGATTEDITLAAGECQQVYREFTFTPESLDQRPDIKVVAWAQEAKDTGPAEVYQSEGWQYQADIFADGFESGDTSVWSSTVD
jgi:hypothetical protein